MKQKLLCFIVLGLLLISSAYAQNRRISGRVISSNDGNPLAGVSVGVLGTSINTQSNTDGAYSIEVPAGSQTLVFSYIGFATQNVTLGSSNTINVVLQSEQTELDEVVVVAYGAVRREAITGSVASIQAEDLEKRVITNVTNALAGMAPGVTVSAANGQPGTGSTVRLRGFGSFAASNAPLYVLDGAPFDGSISDINAEDIESVSVLKDATSTALYGARGGNGVIMITTKRGRTDKPALNLSLNQGFSKRGIDEYDRVDAYEYYPLMWEAIKNGQLYKPQPLSDAAARQFATNNVYNELKYNPFDVPNNEIVGVDGALNPAATLLYNDFDWYNAIMRTGNRSNANLSVSGRSNTTDYLFSLGYLNDKGYLIGSDFERYNARINANSEINSWLSTGLNVSGSNSGGSLASDAGSGSANSFVNPFNFIRGLGPIYPVRAYDNTGAPILDENGEHYFDYGMHPGAINRPTGANPGRHVVYETMLNPISNRRTLLGARFYAEIKFLKDFTFRPSISVDYNHRTNDQFRSPILGDGATLQGYAYNLNSSTRSYTFNQILSYNKQFDAHTVEAFVGHENYDYAYSVNTAGKTNQILSGNTEFDNFVTLQSIAGSDDVNRIESYLSKVAYSYDGKYFLDASVRRDGSSRFHQDNRWGTFYSVGGAWYLSRENFMGQVDWMDELRLRASFGQVGNENLSTYYAYQAFYSLGWNNGINPGVLLSTLATPNLGWETSNTYNLGLSFGLFNRRIFGDLEFYRRGSSNLIFDLPLAVSDPVTTIKANIGDMYNSGIELQLGADIVRGQDFTWTMTTNWSVLKNEITKMPEDVPHITSGTKRREVGRDYYSFWLRQYAGVDPSDGAALYIPADDTAPELIRQVNGTDYVTTITNAKFDYSGTAIPDLIGSVNNSFTYRDFGLSFLINYQIGGKYYDGEYAILMAPSYGGALHRDVLNSWDGPGQTSDVPRLDINASPDLNGASTRWLVDASYIGFTNVNLSYNLPRQWLQGMDVSNFRIFASGENLGIISKRRGLNPTESVDGTNSTTYVPSRIINFGINLSF